MCPKTLAYICDPRGSEAKLASAYPLIGVEEDKLASPRSEMVLSPLLKVGDSRRPYSNLLPANLFRWNVKMVTLDRLEAAFAGCAAFRREVILDELRGRKGHEDFEFEIRCFPGANGSRNFRGAQPVDVLR